MASHAVPNGHVGAHAKTLAAGVVDTVTFEVATPDTPGWGRVPTAVEVVTNGAADIYITVDGSAPTVGGTHCWHLPAYLGSAVLNVGDSNPHDPVVVKLISAGTPQYSVSRAR